MKETPASRNNNNVQISERNSLAVGTGVDRSERSTKRKMSMPCSGKAGGEEDSSYNGSMFEDEDNNSSNDKSESQS